VDEHRLAELPHLDDSFACRSEPRHAGWRRSCSRAWQERSGENDRELSPRFAGGRTIALYRRWQAERIVAEKNFGRDMVEVKIRAVDSSVSFRAATGSLSGPEPFAVLFEQDRMKAAGIFPQLKDGCRTYCGGRHAEVAALGPLEATSAYIKGLALPKSVKNGILGRSVIEETGSTRSSENG
jgi:hypothetical protein